MANCVSAIENEASITGDGKKNINILRHKLTEWEIDGKTGEKLLAYLLDKAVANFARSLTQQEALEALPLALGIKKRGRGRPPGSIGTPPPENPPQEPPSQEDGQQPPESES